MQTLDQAWLDLDGRSLKVRSTKVNLLPFTTPQISCGIVLRNTSEDM